MLKAGYQAGYRSLTCKIWSSDWLLSPLVYVSLLVRSTTMGDFNNTIHTHHTKGTLERLLGLR